MKKQEGLYQNKVNSSLVSIFSQQCTENGLLACSRTEEFEMK